MAKLRKKAWDLNEMTPCVEKTDDTFRTRATNNENELVKINTDLVKIEKNVVSIHRKRANETSVSYNKKLNRFFLNNESYFKVSISSNYSSTSITTQCQSTLSS